MEGRARTDREREPSKQPSTRRGAVSGDGAGYKDQEGTEQARCLMVSMSLDKVRGIDADGQTRETNERGQ